MNILLEELPQKVSVGGMEYLIDSDFRTSISYELLVQDEEISDVEKVSKAIMLYYPDEVPSDIVAAMEKIIWFYSCGKPPKTKRPYPAVEDDADPEKEDGPEEDEEEEQEPAWSEKAYSFEHDAPYIYAAFMEQYGIDLTEIGYMHWWKFRALFQALSENTQFMKIVGYRNVDITDKMTKEQKKFYRQMKKMYALPLPEKEVKRQNAIVEALMNGGDLSGLL